jgi:AcrR family transcriptional regulator
MSDSSGPVQLRAIATRDAIIRAAAAIFDAQGYAATGVDQIIKAAGITKGGLYFHFRSKAAIAEALVRQVEETWEGLRERVEADAAVHGWSHLEQLHQVALAVAEESRTSIATSGAIRLSDEWNAIATELPVPLRTWVHFTVRQLELAQAAGEAAASLDILAAARVIVSSIYGIDRVSRRPGEDRSKLADRIEEWWTLLLPGLTST